MKRRNRRNSGQVLIIVALIITLLLLSTSLYVAESLRNEMVYQSDSNQRFSFYEQGIRHTVISALANVSNGGNSRVLLEDLDRFEATLTNCTYHSMLEMTTTLLNITPYQDGIWIERGTNGKGITSAYVSCSVDSRETSSVQHSDFSVNVTSEIEVAGRYTLVTPSIRHVNLTCTAYNEGEPVLAQNFTIYYESDGYLATEEWVPLSPDITDFGNGTYTISFTVSTLNQWTPLFVLVKCQDLRNILVQTIATCIET